MSSAQVRRELELAIVELEKAISSGADESVFQTVFEEYEVIRNVLGYRRWIPHPVLRSAEGPLIPDFIAELPTGVWEIVELKLPEARLLLGRTRR
jgi:hypothetical protein